VEPDPGGYLRSLTDRARSGQFSTWPMVMALLSAKLEAGRERRGDVVNADASLSTGTAVERAQGRLDISEALRRSLERKGRE
jgi:replication initiation protein RepC